MSLGRILVVDDDESLRRVMQVQLEDLGYDVATAADGDVALQSLQLASRELVISDMKMPGMSGIDLLRKVRAGYPETIVVVVTAFGTVLGQAPWAPYSPERVRMWRLDWELSAGAIADMGPHYFDFAQWARGDETSGPVEYEGFGIFRREKKLNTIPGVVDVRARYADGTLLRIDSGPKGVRFDGDEGWIQLNDEGAITAYPKSVLAGRDVPNVGWNVMAPHIRNFLDCMRSREQTVSSPEVSQRSHTIAHCANLSIRLDRKLCWDPEVELFIGDEQANNMLARSMRAPWRI